MQIATRDLADDTGFDCLERQDDAGRTAPSCVTSRFRVHGPNGLAAARADSPLEDGLGLGPSRLRDVGKATTVVGG